MKVHIECTQNHSTVLMYYKAVKDLILVYSSVPPHFVHIEVQDS